MTEPQCFLCLARSEVRPLSLCPSCRLVYTCSLHHHLHYTPTGGCYAFTVRYDSQVGRYLVATRRIKQGEIIYRDSPAVTGPNISRTESHCISCMRQGCEEECEDCGYPVCGPACAKAEIHREECQVFQQAGYRYEGTTAYCAVTVLRLLLVMEREGEESLLGSMMDHNQERMEEQPEVWNFETEFVVSRLQDRLGLRSRFTEAQIRRAAGILATNSTSLQFPSEDHVKGNGLYPVYSMMNHSCSCNTKTIIDSSSQFEMTIMAHVDIEAGEQITNQYTRPDQPSLYRRPLLRQKWFFHCRCPRCEDPTELGSHLSSLRCRQGEGRQECGGTVLLSSPLSLNSHWTCQRCGHVLSNDQAYNILDMASTINEKALSTQQPGKIDHNGNYIGCSEPKDSTERALLELSVLEEAEHNLSTLLHHHNHFVIQVKQRLIELYGGRVGPDVRNPELQRQIQLCSDVTDCLTRVDSGYSEWRTKIIPALSRAKMMSAHRDLQRGLISKSRFDKLLMENRFMIMFLAYQHAKVKL